MVGRVADQLARAQSPCLVVWSLDTCSDPSPCGICSATITEPVSCCSGLRRGRSLLLAVVTPLYLDQGGVGEVRLVVGLGLGLGVDDAGPLLVVALMFGSLSRLS